MVFFQLFLPTLVTTTKYVFQDEGNVLFNDALNTFYLWLHEIRYMVKDHSDSERKNPLLPLHGLLIPFNGKGSFICTIPLIGEHLLCPLLYQLWSTGWNKK